jgi:hypothetical protein
MNTQRASEPPLRRHFAALKAKIASLPEAEDKGSKRVAELKAKAASLPRTLPEAKQRLAELQQLAIGAGIKPTLLSAEAPRTLDAARRQIVNFEAQLRSQQPAAETKSPALETAENLYSRARAVIARSRAQSAALTREAVHTVPAVQDMSARQLQAEIESAQKAKNFERVENCYRQLRGRRNGKGTRAIIEAAAGMSDRELALRIENERDPEKQAMLYSQLVARRAQRNH